MKQKMMKQRGLPCIDCCVCYGHKCIYVVCSLYVYLDIFDDQLLLSLVYKMFLKTHHVICTEHLLLDLETRDNEEIE